MLIVAKVMVGNCQLLPSDGVFENLHSVRTSRGQRGDTFTNDDKDAFYKVQLTETYPEAVLIYRDKNGPPDARTSRINDVIKRGCTVSYRSGTR